MEEEMGSKLVQMKLKDKTLERIESLKDLTEIDNRTQLIAASIELTEELIKAIKNGSKIYIEDESGTKKEKLKIIGI